MVDLSIVFVYQRVNIKVSPIFHRSVHFHPSTRCNSIPSMARVASGDTSTLESRRQYREARRHVTMAGSQNKRKEFNNQTKKTQELTEMNRVCNLGANLRCLEDPWQNESFGNSCLWLLQERHTRIIAPQMIYTEMGCRSRFVGQTLGAQNGWSNDGQNLWELDLKNLTPCCCLLCCYIIKSPVGTIYQIKIGPGILNIEYWTELPEPPNAEIIQCLIFGVFTARRCHVARTRVHPRPFPWNFAPPAVRDFCWFPHGFPTRNTPRWQLQLVKMLIDHGNHPIIRFPRGRLTIHGDAPGTEHATQLPRKRCGLQQPTRILSQAA